MEITLKLNIEDGREYDVVGYITSMPSVKSVTNVSHTILDTKVDLSVIKEGDTYIEAIKKIRLQVQGLARAKDIVDNLIGSGKCYRAANGTLKFK